MNTTAEGVMPIFGRISAVTHFLTIRERASRHAEPPVFLLLGSADYDATGIKLR